MAGKQAGLGCALYAGGYDISGDTQAFTVHGGPNPLDVTDITQPAFSRLGGQRSGDFAWTSFMDAAALAEHAALSPLPTTDVILTAFINPLAAGSPAISQTSKQINYDPTRGQDGMLTFSIDAQSNGFGQEWGIQLTPGLRTDTVATVGSAYDNLAPQSNGAQGYLQVTAFSGTDATVSITHCATSGGAYNPLITFAQTTAAQTAQRVTAAGSVLEFFKVKTVTTGGFSSLTFAVMLAVNLTAVVF